MFRNKRKQKFIQTYDKLNKKATEQQKEMVNRSKNKYFSVNADFFFGPKFGEKHKFHVYNCYESE